MQPTSLQASWDASTAEAWAAGAAFGRGDPWEVRRARTQPAQRPAAERLRSLLCTWGGAALMHAVPLSGLAESHVRQSWELSGVPCHTGL